MAGYNRENPGVLKVLRATATYEIIFMDRIKKKSTR